MKNRSFLFLVLLTSIQAKATGLEVVAGTIVVGAALRTKVVKTASAVMAGYFLNTSAGKRLSALMLQRMFGNYTVNNFQLGSSVSGIVSRFSKPSGMSLSFKAPSSVASIKEKMKSLNPFGQRYSKVNHFQPSESNLNSGYESTSGSDIFYKLRDSFYKTKNTVQDQKTVNVMAQQVNGFFPKIENNYYSGNYYKGAFHGSFAAWLSAWFLMKHPKNEEQKDLKIEQPVSTHQELASLIESDLKKS